MKNFNYRFILTIIVFIFSGFEFQSCTNLPSPKKNNNKLTAEIRFINKGYEKAIRFFKKDYVSFFPKELDSNFVDFTDSFSPKMGEVGLYLTCKLTNNNLTKYFAKNAIATYYPLDTCLLVVNRFAAKTNFYNIKISMKDKILINRSCYKNKYPIPNFYATKFSINSTACKLSKDFTIYVLDSRYGKYLNDSLLTDGRYMPANWSNGMSKGVAISKKKHIIIYWLTIW